MYIIIYILFFIPSLTAVIDFFYYLYFGTRLVSGPIAGLVDLFNLAVAPSLFLISLEIWPMESIKLLQTPFFPFSLIVIILSVLGYFLLQILQEVLTNKPVFAILILLCLGILINIEIMKALAHPIIVFNIAIVLTFMIQIGSQVKRLLNPKSPHSEKHTN